MRRNYPEPSPTYPKLTVWDPHLSMINCPGRDTQLRDLAPSITAPPGVTFENSRRASHMVRMQHHGQEIGSVPPPPPSLSDNARDRVLPASQPATGFYWETPRNHISQATPLSQIHSVNSTTRGWEAQPFVSPGHLSGCWLALTHCPPLYGTWCQDAVKEGTLPRRRIPECCAHMWTKVQMPHGALIPARTSWRGCCLESRHLWEIPDPNL